MRLRTLLFSTVIGLTNCVAAEADELHRLKGIYETLYNTFSEQTKDLADGSGNVFFVLINPGVFIDPGLKFNDASTQQEIDNRRAFTAFMDRLVDPNWIYTPRLEKLFDLYGDIIEHDRAVLSIELTKDQQKQLDAAVSLLTDGNGGKSKKYSAYQDAQKAVAGLASQIKLKQTANQPIDPSLTQAYMSANDDFKAIGNKAEILSALNASHTLNAQRPEYWWGELGLQFEDPENIFILSAGTHEPKYLFYPEYRDWTKDEYNWTTLHVKSEILDGMHETSHTSVGGSGGGGFAFWSGKSNYNQDTQRDNKFNSEDEFLLEVQATQVFIDRPWFEARVFTAPVWTWSKDSTRRQQYNGLLSDGKNPNLGETPQGYSPFIPVSLILAKNVTVSSSFSTQKRDYFAQTTSGNSSVSWGPFSGGGNYNNSQTSEYTHGTLDEASLKIGNPQIIGMFVRVLPNTPIEKAGAKYVDPASAPK
jgi:hypothetical protein